MLQNNDDGSLAPRVFGFEVSKNGLISEVDAPLPKIAFRSIKQTL